MKRSRPKSGSSSSATSCSARPTSFADDQSFLESGIIDSTGLLELVSFVEERYGISIADRELMPENLDSLKNLSQFVARKLEAVGAKG